MDAQSTANKVPFLEQAAKTKEPNYRLLTLFYKLHHSKLNWTECIKNEQRSLLRDNSALLWGKWGMQKTQVHLTFRLLFRGDLEAAA